MTEKERQFLLFSGRSHPALAKEVATQLGVSLGKVDVATFPDGEISLQVNESVRGRDVFIMQTIALDPNNLLVELLVMIDALKRASARSITVIAPYLGYCRQDRKDKPRVPIAAKLVANLIEKAGASRVITFDLHAEQVQGFFDIPVENLHARPFLASAFLRQIEKPVVVVAPDAGGVKLARDFAKELNVPFAILDKNRLDAHHVEVVTVIGDITGKNVLLADDMCTTASTLVSAAKACQERGAKSIFAAITHGLFVGPAIGKLADSPIETLFVSNTVPSNIAGPLSKKIVSVSIAPLLSQAIECILDSKSISSLTAINSL